MVNYTLQKRAGTAPSLLTEVDMLRRKLNALRRDVRKSAIER
jgi:hypothetical protein